MDESKVHELAKKVGGRFRLTTLMQKRLIELNRGDHPLVNERYRNPLNLVVREIDEEKIILGQPETAEGETSAMPELGFGDIE